MGRAWIVFVLLGLLAATSGCTMCQNPFDYNYAGYGGSVPANNAYGGRAGSAFGPGPVAQQSGQLAQQPTPQSWVSQASLSD